MTATTIPANQEIRETQKVSEETIAFPTSPSKGIFASESQTARSVQVVRTERARSHETSSVQLITGLNASAIAGAETRDLPIERIYPQLFDDSFAGQVNSHIDRALKDAQLALAAFSEADLEAVGDRLNLIAPAMARTHRLCDFNDSLGAVVSFVRRAVLTTSSADITRPALNALVHVLHSIAANPMIDLDDACDLIDKLSDEGWQGEHGIADMLVAALLDYPDAEGDVEVQAQLFTEHGDREGEFER